MSLHAWQTRLSDIVIAQSAKTGVSQERIDRLEQQLSETERTWLDRVQTTPGFSLMCDIQRRWREFRVQTAAPLTSSVLAPERRQEVIAAFITRNPTSSIFFLSEALPFLDLATELAGDVPHLPELAAFERARLLLANDQPADAAGDLDLSCKLEVHPLACVIRFRAPAERVIAAAMRGLPLPRVENRDYCVLIARRLPDLVRLCVGAEANVFEELRVAPAAPDTFADDPLALDAVTSLWQAGALQTVS